MSTLCVSELSGVLQEELFYVQNTVLILHIKSGVSTLSGLVSAVALLWRKKASCYKRIC